MPASFRSTASATATLGGDPVVNVPAGTVNGDLLVAVGAAASGTLTASGAWTVHPNSLSTQTPLWTRVASSEPASYTFVTGSAANSIVTIVAIRNAASVDVAAGVVATSGDAVIPSIVSSGAGRLLMQMVVKTASTSYTPPGSVTERYDTGGIAPANYSAAGGDEIVGGGATGTRTWVPSSSPSATVGYMLAVAPIPPKLGSFAGGYDFSGTFEGQSGAGQGSFSGSYDFSGTFTG